MARERQLKNELKKKLGLTARILIGMALGIVVGAFFKFILGGETERTLSIFGAELGIKAFFVDGIFHAGGQIFVASLKMLVVPLVFVSLVCGTSSLSDPKALGRLGAKAMGFFTLTTAMAIALAVYFAVLVAPGAGVNMVADTTFNAGAAPSVTDVFINMFPSNPVEAMAKGEMLQLIVFSVLFGVAIAMSGESGLRVRKLFEDLNEVVMKLVGFMMALAPYGVFFLMAKLFTTLDLKDLDSLGWYFGTVLFVLCFHGFLVYGMFIWVFGRLNPFTFFIKMKDAALFAFSTSSSNATMAVNLETTTKKLGVSNNIASFTIPLGATVNMDGTAIMQGVATVFIAQVFQIDLTMSDYLMVILTATLASIGTAGVPGVGLIMLAMVLQQVGLPVEGIALIIGVDRLLDMTRTAVNITGDAMISCLIAQSENQFDADCYNNPDAGKTS